MIPLEPSRNLACRVYTSFEHACNLELCDETAKRPCASRGNERRSCPQLIRLSLLSGSRVHAASTASQIAMSMVSYGVQVASGVFVDARSLLYLTIAWSKGLAAAHELCTRLSAEASVRRLRATPQEPLSAAERLPPEIWALIRSALVLQTVEDVKCDLLRRTLCPRCQADPRRSTRVPTLAELLTCGDCMERAWGTDLDVVSGRGRFQQVRFSLSLQVVTMSNR